MTCLELVTDYVSTVHKLALQLHLVGRPGAMANGDTARPVQKIKALLIRWVSCCLQALQRKATWHSIRAATLLVALLSCLGLLGSSLCLV
jgi:hypothetical protein